MKQANDKFAVDIFDRMHCVRRTKRQPQSIPQDVQKFRRRKAFNFLNKAEDVK